MRERNLVWRFNIKLGKKVVTSASQTLALFKIGF